MPTYQLRPNADNKANWTEVPTGAAWSCLDEAINYPSIPTLTDYITTTTASILSSQELQDLTLQPGEAITSIKALAYIDPGAKGCNLGVANAGVFEGSDPAQLTIPPGYPPNWYGTAYSGPKTNAFVNALEVMVQAGATAGTAICYAMYLEVLTAISTYSDRVLSLTPSLYWRLGPNDSAGSITDLSGNGHSGTKSGTVAFNKPTLLPNADGGSVKMSSDRDQTVASGIKASGYKPFVAGSQRTFEAWVKFAAPALTVANGAITSASNATPVVITTTNPHGLETDDAVRVSGVTGNANANNGVGAPSASQPKARWWWVTRLSATTFSIQSGENCSTFGGLAFNANVVGSGAGTGGGWDLQITGFPTLFAGDGMSCISGNVSGATSANPIEITTSATHHLQTGDFVTIASVGGNTAANGGRYITVTASNKFTIPVGWNGAYTSGGTWQLGPQTPHPTLEWGDNLDGTAFARWYGRVMTYPGGWHDNGGGYNGAGSHRVTMKDSHHTVWRWDDTAHVGDLIIDGISMGQIGPLDFANSSVIRWEDTTRGDPGNFTVGYRGSGIWNFESMDGYLQDVAVYQRLLTDAEILGNYVAGGGTQAIAPAASRARGTTPRLDLNVEAITPGGRRYRWSQDESDPEQTTSGLSFSTSVPGGFDRMDVSLTRDPRIDYADLERLTTLRVLGAGGEVASEYRLEAAPRSTGLDRMDVSPGAVGWQAHLSDDETFTGTYVGRDLDHWEPAGVQWQQGMYNLYGSPFKVLGSVESTRDSTSQLPALVATLPPALRPFAGALYDSESGVVQIDFSFLTTGMVAGGNQWIAQIGTTNTDSPSYAGGDIVLPLGSPITALSAPVQTWSTSVVGSPYRYAQFVLVGDDNDYGKDVVMQLGDLAVWGAGAIRRGVSPDDGVAASDVIADCLDKAAPLIRHSTTTISDSGFIIPHVAYHDPTTAADVVVDVNRYHSWPWAVWEDPTGIPARPTFYYRPAGVGVRRWSVRAGPSNLQEAGPQLNRLWNGVTVTYSDVSGVNLRVGPPGSAAEITDPTLADPDPENPANKLGIRRWINLSMDSVSTAAGAIKVGSLFLALQKDADQSGSASLIGTVLDDKGVEHPAWLVRAGDLIRFPDSTSGLSWRRIVRTNYDDSSKTNSVDLDVPPDYLETVLQRLGVSTKPLGF